MIDNLDPTTQPGHFWKFLAMGPDGKLYFNVGSPGNIVMPSYMQAIDQPRRPEDRRDGDLRARRAQLGRLRLAPAHARSCGSPTTRATGSATTCRTTRCTGRRSKGMNFGFPFCHQGDIARPRVRQGPLVQRVRRRRPLKLGAHIAPLGMRFYTGSMFPAEYRNNMFIAMHGSWNRTNKQGYNVMRVERRRQGQGRS